MKSKFFCYLNSWLFLALAVLGTTIVGGNSIPVWADVIEGTEEPDVIVGTPEDDIIDSIGGDGSGSDIIVSGEGDDQSTGNGGRDIFVCGDGEDTVTDFNEAEGDIATPDCENV
jgi:hypothetical protein